MPAHVPARRHARVARGHADDDLDGYDEVLELLYNLNMALDNGNEEQVRHHALNAYDHLMDAREHLKN